MLDLEALRSRLHSKYPDAVVVSDTAIRFTRKDKDEPFAVYYVAVAPRLPDSAEALNRYQDELVGKRYFEGPKNLQWSNYLYLVTTPEQLRRRSGQRAKELIESDRTYARKFVVLETEIESALNPPTEGFGSSDLGENVSFDLVTTTHGGRTAFRNIRPDSLY